MCVYRKINPTLRRAGSVYRLVHVDSASTDQANEIISSLNKICPAPPSSMPRAEFLALPARRHGYLYPKRFQTSKPASSKIYLSTILNY